MGKIKLVESFKNGDIADTSNLLLPREYYSTYWENSNDEEFYSRNGKLEYAANYPIGATRVFRLIKKTNPLLSTGWV